MAQRSGDEFWAGLTARDGGRAEQQVECGHLRSRGRLRRVAAIE
jgi:hypothetical protein